MLTTHQHNFRFDVTTAELLRDLAASTGLSQSDVVRQAIRQYAARERRIQNGELETTPKTKKTAKNLSP